jgi:transposase
MNTKKSPHPAWALAHKKPGTELRKIKGRYYLYDYKTVYDKGKKGPRKVTGPILGSITEEDGFIPSEKRSLEKAASGKVISKIQCKEYGITRLILSRFEELTTSLKDVFADDWKELLAIAYCRFVYRCPLKSIPFRLATSYLPETLGLEPFSEKRASGVLNRIGGQRDRMLKYMRSFIGKGEYILMDTTDIFSNSKNISLARPGYSHDLQYGPQFNLMYIYSANSRMPVYYRLLAGNIRDVKAFKNCMIESGLTEAIVVADKGFYSISNVSLLQKEQIQFILPLKRNNSMIDYSDLVRNEFKTADRYFDHEKRVIWHKVFPADNDLHLYLFLDEQLKVREDADYLTRVKTHPEKYDIETYHKIKDRFGTIALLSSLNIPSDNIYQTYKSRIDIEVMFDGMKNVLEADHTYMQNEQTLEGWMFINHITLQWYQYLYIELKEKELIKKISVNDLIQLLTDVKKIRINDQWYLNEYTSHTQKLIDKLAIKII